MRRKWLLRRPATTRAVQPSGGCGAPVNGNVANGAAVGIVDPHPLGPQLGAGGNAEATGKADYVKALADEVQRGGIAAWKALRDLLPRDEDVPSGSPTVGIGQLFIAAHKEINRLEQTKTGPPVIDVIAEPILALPGPTNTRDGAGGGQPAATASHGAASTSPARVQSETAQDGDNVEW
jgi:hypothetical protein